MRVRRSKDAQVITPVVLATFFWKDDSESKTLQEA
jgi:hypothetical protein